MTEGDKSAFQNCAKSVRMIAASAIMESEGFPRSPAMFLDLAKEAHRLFWWLLIDTQFWQKLWRSAEAVVVKFGDPSKDQDHTVADMDEAYSDDM